MAWFDASVQSDVVRIGWESLDETGIVGYDIQRQAVDGEYETINSELILADNAGISAGSSYSYEDAGATNDLYRYRLLIVTAAGGVDAYGMSEVLVLGQRLYTPLIFD